MAPRHNDHALETNQGPGNPASSPQVDLIPGAAASRRPETKIEAQVPQDDFLIAFMEDSGHDQAEHVETKDLLHHYGLGEETLSSPGEAKADLATTSPDIAIRPLVAARDLQQIFPMQEPREALTLAAMPHYDLGGKQGVRMGQLEMRWLMADATVTIDGDKDPSASLSHNDLKQEADRGIKSLLQGGYIRQVELNVEERRSQAQINEVLRENFPGGWESLDTGVNPAIAFELTDSGIAAGRSIRIWNGNTPDAGLVRLPEGQPMPRVVASDSYDLSAAVMENRSLSGVLKPGEMGAFLQAELATIEFGHQTGSNPVVTIGRLDGVVDMATLAALDQIQNGQVGQNAPIRPEDLTRIINQSYRTLEPLPDLVPAGEDAGPQQLGLGKEGSKAAIARLEGVRLGTELISFQQAGVKGGVDMAKQRSWNGAVQFDQSNTLAMRDAIKVAKNWMTMAATKGVNIGQDLRAMSQGAFGAPGGAIAEQMLAKA